MDIKKHIKRNMYRWHRAIGIITVIPVIFWTLSGLMHPFLSHWFKPQIAHEKLVDKPIDSNKVKLDIVQVLAKNSIDRIKNFRLVKMDNNYYYQIKGNDLNLSYYNASNGTLLSNGDVLYAKYLARYFIADSTSAISRTRTIDSFNREYQYINRLLPAWKISFARKDNMDVYVETSSSRLATFNPTSRKVFIWIFYNFHTWGFLDAISNNTLKTSILIILSSFIASSALSGLLIYGLLWGKFKSPAKNSSQNLLRKYHRQIGIWVSVFTLMFAFSGAYHATRKLKPNDLPKMVYQPSIDVTDIQTSFKSIAINWQRLENLSLVKWKKDICYQVSYLATDDEPTTIEYFNAKTGNQIPNGDIGYAKYLAKRFSAPPAENNDDLEACCVTGSNGDEEAYEAEITKAKVMQRFDNREYGFVFKRLPVVRLDFDTENKLAYYIETKTSRLAAKVTNADRAEGYSFAFLHKYLFMDWAGKNVRDSFMMLAAFTVLLVSILGFILFIRRR